ncbi:acetate/propionate family kinase [Propionivibrio sp.]|uniref:acetate/propionate family kinase n=1 Tax=Propionivibrio sp. TaxID=2212460 RepID=UPI0025D34B62|nr:acetate/propionate family kinase [Propionivibrio sp.]MBK7355250.1 acetate/propionate family kinase [Propionivibrio sp.]MBK8399645.1 acetate/propionate family kinase [Propionivibrio sp.]MBL0208625.1 acetate/propionate family kinase [Propionivibrio sp.]
MSDAILVLNAGSSSIKFSLFLERGESLELFLGGQLEGIYTSPKFKAKDATGTVIGDKQWASEEALGHDGALSYLADFLRGHLGPHRLAAVGHRVVHGGLDYAAPVRLTHGIVADLEKLIPLAPLHQPHNLTPIRLMLADRPELPQVACFDTAFHRGQPAVAQAFALPSAITERGVRRYGFHGLSYEYIASVLAKYDPSAAQGRTVVLHLGNGASMCAIQNGNSVASTMGFTAVDGLPMGTRCGNLDPGVVLYLMDELKMDVRAIEKLLYQQSGLLGVSGVSSDMRTLLDSTDPKAEFAIDLFVYRIGRELGSLAAALGGLNALVFTAGIGEHAAPIRERVCQVAAWLGVELDPVANAAGGPRISRSGSRIPVWVIPTNEELMIALHTRHILNTVNAAAPNHDC